MQHSSQISKHALSCTQGGTHQNAATFVAKKTFYSITETFHFCFALGLLCFYSVFNVFIVCLLDLHSVMLRFIIAVAESHKAFVCTSLFTNFTFISQQCKKYVDSITKNPCFAFGSSVFLRCFNVFIACLLYLFCDVRIHYCCDTFTKILSVEGWG